MKHKYLLLQTDPKHRKSLYNNRVKQGTAGQSPDILKHLTKQNLTKALYYAAVLLIIAGAFYFASKVNKTSNTIKLNQLELKSTQYKLRELNSSYDAVLKEKAATSAEKSAQDAKVQELEKAKTELERQLQSKLAEKQRTASIQTSQRVYAASSHSEWLAAAGIPQDQWAAAEILVQRESGWQTGVINSIGCIGLLQNCPDRNGYYWLKEACPNWQNDPVCQLKRFNIYAQQRYGGFIQGLAHSYANNWW